MMVCAVSEKRLRKIYYHSNFITKYSLSHLFDPVLVSCVYVVV